MRLTPPWKMKDRIDKYSTYLSIGMVIYILCYLITGRDLGMLYVLPAYAVVALSTSVRSWIQTNRVLRQFRAERGKALHQLPPHRQEELNINRAKRVLAAKYPEGR
jgi:hypothetical protein